MTDGSLPKGRKESICELSLCNHTRMHRQSHVAEMFLTSFSAQHMQTCIALSFSLSRAQKTDVIKMGPHKEETRTRARERTYRARGWEREREEKQCIEH